MQTGFRIHKQAVMIECSLNYLMDCAKGRKGSEVADITLIYDRPVSFINEVLQTLMDDVFVKGEQKYFIKEMKQRYSPFTKCVLAQLEERVCYGLCDDLQMLLDDMETNDTKSIERV